MLRQHVKFSVKMILRQRIKPYTDSKHEKRMHFIESAES